MATGDWPFTKLIPPNKWTPKIPVVDGHGHWSVKVYRLEVEVIASTRNRSNDVEDHTFSLPLPNDEPVSFDVDTGELILENGLTSH